MQDMYRNNFSHSEHVDVSSFNFFFFLLLFQWRSRQQNGKKTGLVGVWLDRAEWPQLKWQGDWTTIKFLWLRFGASLERYGIANCRFYERITRYFHTFSFIFFIFGWLISNLWFWPIDFIQLVSQKHVNAKFHAKKKIYFIVVCYFILSSLGDLRPKRWPGQQLNCDIFLR